MNSTNDCQINVPPLNAFFLIHHIDVRLNCKAAKINNDDYANDDL